MRTEILVVGGGLGGVAAALAAHRGGRDVLLTEETDWVGGQLTAQAVPRDEHPWIERFGCTASYRLLRDGIRAHYRAHYPLTAQARARPALNPGAGRVSAMCCESRAALAQSRRRPGGGRLRPRRRRGRSRAVDLPSHRRAGELRPRRLPERHHAIANWPQLDCETGEPADARELSLSFLHWLQAEQGLPGLRLRGDVTGTPDGLAKALYVRESRRTRDGVPLAWPAAVRRSGD
jgi:glycine/D-amino acid oxidase-like deaminating enzyme